MSNLLPEKTQIQIRKEYRARFLMTGSSLAIAAAVFTVLALSPSFSVLFITRPETDAKVNQMTQGKQDSADIAYAQSLVRQLSPLEASSTVSAIILDALNSRPSGIHIDTIVYETTPSGTMTIGGSADSRADIDKYRTILQSDPNFSSVKLPVGDLLGAQGESFTITLSGHF